MVRTDMPHYLDVHNGAHLAAPICPRDTFTVDVERAPHALRTRGHPYALASRVYRMIRLEYRGKAAPVCPQWIALLRTEDERAPRDRVDRAFSRCRMRIDRPCALPAVPEGVDGRLSGVGGADEPHLALRV